MRTRSIVLVGMRGCGKTAVGRRLALAMNRPFVDLDEQVTAREGFESVAAMWASVGQGAFREAEAAALREELLRDEPRVLALGGGTLTAPDAAETLRTAKADGRVLVVYLRCTIDTLRARVAGDANRPSVTGADPLDELNDLLRAREPAYREVSDVEIDADGDSPDRVADEIVRALG